MLRQYLRARTACVKMQALPHRTPHLPCLHCSDPAMKLVDKSGVSYLRCDRCLGVWIREPEFMSLMEQARPGKDNALLVHNDGSKRRNCPICSVRMEVAWLLFLQMERCEEHGIWFDPGELERALAGDFGGEVLVQVNDSAKARQKAQANRHREQSKGAARPWLRALQDFLK